jgi:hypothetical protein
LKFQEAVIFTPKVGEKQLLKRNQNKKKSKNQDAVKIAQRVKDTRVFVLTIKFGFTSKSHLFHSSKFHFCVK